MNSCQEKLERCLLTRPSKSEKKVPYTPELRREARETFNEVHGRYPTSQELRRYIASDQEAIDFYKIKNACLV
jgi:hypothetical protein